MLSTCLTSQPQRWALVPAALMAVTGLGLVADRLAIAIGAQWDAEAAMRRLNDPYPLPVSWIAAVLSLADSWGLADEAGDWPPTTWPGKVVS